MTPAPEKALRLEQGKLKWFARRQILATSAAGVGLLVYVSFLLITNYHSAISIQQNLVEMRRQELVQRTEELRNFFDDRKEDVANLVLSREVAVFFENKALGMSMEYGLGQSLVAMRASFIRLMQRKKMGEDTIYSRIVFIDPGGAPLIDTDSPAGSVARDGKSKPCYPPARRKEGIFTAWQDGEEMLVSVPYEFKNAYSGQIIAWIKPAVIYDHVLRREQASKSGTYIVSGKGYIYEPQTAPRRPDLPDIAALTPGRPHEFVMEGPGKPVAMIALRVPVKGTPFFLVHVFPTQEVYGKLAPRNQLVGMGVAAAAIFAALVLVLMVNIKSMVLKARLDESALRERDIQEKNRQLEAEINERRQTERSLRESEERYALASQASNAGLWDWDIDKNEVHYSVRWKALLGYGEDEIGTGVGEWLDRVHPSDLAQLKIEMNSHLDGLTAHLQNEHRVLRKDGTYRWMFTRAVAVRNEDGRAYRMCGSESDVNDRKEAEEQLRHGAFYDGLTDLPNRALFMDRLGHSLRRARREEGRSCAVFFIDLDRFKVVNDSLGHIAGDKLLKETARRLEGCVRSCDTIARLGGDEFVMLFEETGDVEAAKAIAARIGEALAAPFLIEGSEIRCSASIGIAITSPDYAGAEEVLRDADITMYRAKALGRARYEVFDPSMRLEAAALLHLENDLRRALESDEFAVHYQPIVALGTGATTGLEALTRWQHPRRGLVSPGEFIPLAEETGLIVPLGEWVLRTACAQMKAWQDEGIAPLRMAVNISTVQLRQANFFDRLMTILKETGMEPGLLDMEITESVLMDRNEQVIEMFHKLRALGIRICLDDFGTGYSSLSYLKGLPIDVLKIDGSFTRNLTSDKDCGKIVETIVMLGRSLGTDVIAECIETDRQLDCLKAMDCGSGQGFLFSRPVDEKAMKALLSARPDPAGPQK